MIEINRETFLNALLKKDHEGAQTLIEEAHQAALKALDAERDRWLGLLPPNRAKKPKCLADLGLVEGQEIALIPGVNTGIKPDALKGPLIVKNVDLGLIRLTNGYFLDPLWVDHERTAALLWQPEGCVSVQTLAGEFKYHYPGGKTREERIAHLNTQVLEGPVERFYLDNETGDIRYKWRESALSEEERKALGLNHSEAPEGPHSPNLSDDVEGADRAAEGVAGGGEITDIDYNLDVSHIEAPQPTVNDHAPFRDLSDEGAREAFFELAEMEFIVPDRRLIIDPRLCAVFGPHEALAQDRVSDAISRFIGQPWAAAVRRGAKKAVVQELMALREELLEDLGAADGDESAEPLQPAKGNAVVDQNMWKPEPGRWHKVLTLEQAKRFRGCKVTRCYHERLPSRPPEGGLGSGQFVVTNVYRTSGEAWAMRSTSYSWDIACGSPEDEGTDAVTYLWVWE